MRICTENILKFMSKTKLLYQNFLLIFQKSLTSNIFLDPKGGVNPPSPHAHVWYKYNIEQRLFPHYKFKLSWIALPVLKLQKYLKLSVIWLHSSLSEYINQR